MAISVAYNFARVSPVNLEERKDFCYQIANEDHVTPMAAEGQLGTVEATAYRLLADNALLLLEEFHNYVIKHRTVVGNRSLVEGIHRAQLYLVLRVLLI